STHQAHGQTIGLHPPMPLQSFFPAQSCLSVLQFPLPLHSLWPAQQFWVLRPCELPPLFGCSKRAADAERLLLVCWGGPTGRSRSAAGGAAEGTLLGSAGSALDAVEGFGAAAAALGVGASAAAEGASGAAEGASGREGSSFGSSTFITVGGCPPHPE